MCLRFTADFRLNPRDLKSETDLFWLCKIKMCCSVQPHSSGAPCAVSFRDQSHRQVKETDGHDGEMCMETLHFYSLSVSLFNLFLPPLLFLPPPLQVWSSLCSCWGATWSRSAGRTRSYSAEEWRWLVNWASPMSSCQVSRWHQPPDWILSVCVCYCTLYQLWDLNLIQTLAEMHPRLFVNVYESKICVKA